MYTGSGTTQDGVGVSAKKDGYYVTAAPVRFTRVKMGRWQPWNPTIDLVLRKIENPIPMYFKKIVGLEIPKLKEPVGFDLIKADWVAPYGKGIKEDIIFTLDKDFQARDHYTAKLTISFANKGDGIQETNKVVEGSAFLLARYAPESGYHSSYRRIVERTPTSKSAVLRRDGIHYFYRVRAEKDDQGKVSSALYGKIHNDIEISVFKVDTGRISFNYFLNPTPNDRNMEFDGAKNLFKDLKQLERVAQP